MSSGYGYGQDWMVPVGWLGNMVEERAPQPLVQVAKKIAWYISLAGSDIFEGNEEDVPANGFYQLDGEMGWHFCSIGDCNMMLSGVFGFHSWKFPTGIVHYILDHNYLPPEEFLQELATLPDPPEVMLVPPWAAPNIAGMFQS